MWYERFLGSSVDGWERQQLKNVLSKTTHTNAWTVEEDLSVNVRYSSAVVVSLLLLALCLKGLCSFKAYGEFEDLKKNML